MPKYAIKFRIGSYEFQEGSFVAAEPLKKPEWVLGLSDELDKYGIPYTIYEIKIPILHVAKPITKEELKEKIEKKKKR